MVRQFKALSNEHRLSLFLKILEHEHVHGRVDGCVVSELVSDWKICAPTISHHIKLMESARLIDVEKNGKFIIARINLESYAASMHLFHTHPDSARFADALLHRANEPKT